MTPAYIQSLVRKVLREEGLLPVPMPVVTIGPDCQPRALEDEPEMHRVTWAHGVASFPSGPNQAWPGYA